MLKTRDRQRENWKSGIKIHSHEKMYSEKIIKKFSSIMKYVGTSFKVFLVVVCGFIISVFTFSMSLFLIA